MDETKWCACGTEMDESGRECGRCNEARTGRHNRRSVTWTPEAFDRAFPLTAAEKKYMAAVRAKLAKSAAKRAPVSR